MSSSPGWVGPLDIDRWGVSTFWNPPTLPAKLSRAPLPPKQPPRAEEKRHTLPPWLISSSHFSYARYVLSSYSLSRFNRILQIICHYQRVNWSSPFKRAFQKPLCGVLHTWIECLGCFFFFFSPSSAICNYILKKNAVILLPVIREAA